MAKSKESDTITIVGAVTQVTTTRDGGLRVQIEFAGSEIVAAAWLMKVKDEEQVVTATIQKGE